MMNLSSIASAMTRNFGEDFTTDTGATIRGQFHDGILSVPLGTEITPGTELRRQSEQDYVYLTTAVYNKGTHQEATLAKTLQSVVVKRLSGNAKDTFGRSTGDHATVYEAMPVVLVGKFNDVVTDSPDRQQVNQEGMILVSSNYLLHDSDIFEFKFGILYKILDINSYGSGLFLVKFQCI